MARKGKLRNKKNQSEGVPRHNKPRFYVPPEIQRWLWAIVMFLAAIIISLSFFSLAGIAGKYLMRSAAFLIGRVIFIVPIFFTLAGILIIKTQKNHFLASVALVVALGFIGVEGVLGSLGAYYNKETQELGGWLGYIISFVPMAAFSIWVSLVIFFGFVVAGILIGWMLVKREISSEEEFTTQPEGSTLFKKVFAPKFKVTEINAVQDRFKGTKEQFPQAKENIADAQRKLEKVQSQELIALREHAKTLYPYKLPPLDLLETDRGSAQSGDIKVNSAIIKRTLENFGIPVEISEVNVGPAVTQFAVKPAEGIKLSKIVALNNDLALALAAHPIRIEAPIPGRSLVGIEVPNKVRAFVGLRHLMESSMFQGASSSLTLALGKDVAGNPVYADLAKMPHLLVAGSTGTGKTIGLNAVVMSLLYQNSPSLLRLILIDPKRVEFPVYNDLPHLLTPVIYDAQKTVNALKWLVGEMERRFDVLSKAKARDIASYNQAQLKEQEEIMPYLVLIVDELADLMAARGRDIEAGIVRLAQMARAVGIHLVVATQRPSVEVITGLIKANITARMAFQVASQVDSRTVLDAAGAEKLIGLGDMLFISADISKPKRIQGAYVSDKEVRRVAGFVRDQVKEGNGGVPQELMENMNAKLAEGLEKSLEQNNGESDSWGEGDDTLYEEAKKLVIETRKASASYLQRRLRVGYARAARLIDMLEEKGVVGPGEGAKPRNVLLGGTAANDIPSEDKEGWTKV